MRIRPLPFVDLLDALIEQRDLFSEPANSCLVSAQFVTELHAHEYQQNDGDEEEKLFSILY